MQAPVSISCKRLFQQKSVFSGHTYLKEPIRINLSFKTKNRTVNLHTTHSVKWNINARACLLYQH